MDKSQDNISVQKGVARRFRSYKRRLGFPTNNDFLDALLRMVSTRNLTRFQIYAYGEPIQAQEKQEGEPYVPIRMPTPEDYGIDEKRDKNE